MARPKLDFSAPPKLRPQGTAWQRPAARAISMTGPDQFLYLNEIGDLNADGWDNPKKAKLWRYNQHYFDDLNARNATERSDWHRLLIYRWIAENLPPVGSGWEPYPTSLRIVNWVKYSLAGQNLGLTAEHSLAIQARWLSQRLEWHLMGNHLFANAKALLFVGLYFDGPEAERFRALSVSILAREVSEQILSDGGQFELSPMYHALALEDVLDLVNLLETFKAVLSAPEQSLLTTFKNILPNMITWLETMSHPDGGIAFFNDAAFGIAPENNELLSYADRLGFTCNPTNMLETVTHLKSSGYARLQAGQAIIFCDLARIGPNYLPGHAHADTLSFEFSLFGQRVFVNSGTSEYGLGAERLRQRGTKAHNTVTVRNCDSSEVWSGFRVARRAGIKDVTVMPAKDCALVAEGSHDGYTRLPSGPMHHRRWHLNDGSMRVSDTLSSDHPSEARFHLHPQIQAELYHCSAGILRLPGGQNIRISRQDGPFFMDQATWHPEFGKVLTTSCLTAPLINGQCRLDLAWD